LTIYADTSFIVSYYLQDVHSPNADRRMKSSPSLWVTPLNRTEFAHALHQYVFRAAITLVQSRLVWQDFEDDCSNGVWREINLPENIWERSIDLARRHGPALGVRTLDSLHVACAVELKARRFWTFDERQAKLAETVGLSTAA